MAESLVKFRVDARDAIRKIRELGNATGRLAKQNLKAQKSFGGLQGVLTKLALVETGRRMTNMAASFKQTQIRLELLSKQYGENAGAQDLAARAAERFGLSQTEALSGITDIYGRLRPIGVTLKEIETTYMGFNVATKLAGVSAQQASGAFLQLSQALGSGRLQGDEYRSIAEQLPILTQVIAKEMGKPVGQIKKLASEGKVTSEVVIKALKRIEQDGGKSIEKLMARSPEQQFKNLQNAISDLSVELGAYLVPVVVEVSKALTAVVRTVSKAPEWLKASAVGIGGVVTVTGILVPLIYKAYTAVRILRIFIYRKLLPTLGLTRAAMGPIVLGLTALSIAIAKMSMDWIAAKDAEEEHMEVMKSLNKEVITNTLETEENTRTRLINQRSFWEWKKGITGFSFTYRHLTKKIKESTERLEELNQKLKDLPGQIAADEIKKASEAMGALKDITAQTSAQFQDAFAKKFSQYAKTVHDFGGQVGDIVTKSFRGMEDALVQFVQTGKLAFSDFARSIIADMTRIAIRQTIIAPLMSGFSGWLGDKFGPTKYVDPLSDEFAELYPAKERARGGPVRGGSPYLVGERGPELFVPGSSGNITPNHQLGGSTSVVVNVDASGSAVSGDAGQAEQLGSMLAAAVQAEILNQQRPGGLLAGTR
mgnify:CR=1 FL=1|tara:strand:+ start:21 stop:1979 length:1959 start_codon:yes stop_codon:yes gene_type:complete